MHTYHAFLEWSFLTTSWNLSFQQIKKIHRWCLNLFVQHRMNTLILSKSHETTNLYDTYVDIESRMINQKCTFKRIWTKDETDCTINSSEYLQQQDEAKDANWT